MTYRIERWAVTHDVSGFDCGRPEYNDWLRTSDRVVSAGTAAVYVLVHHAGGNEEARVVGYVAVAPTAVRAADLPNGGRGGLSGLVPGYLVAKLAVDVSHQKNADEAWGSQLLREGLRIVVEAADVSGGRVIVVEPDGPGLDEFYAKHGFLPTGSGRMYMKVATARRLIEV